jgi:prepilin-type N-terminal cleavage/methylation domain-containing protein
MNGRRSGRTPRGYTLIECLAAVLILGLGLVGSVGSLTAALLANQKASDTQLATALAQKTIEAMRSEGFGSVNYTDFPASATKTTDPDLGALQGGSRTTVITDNYSGDARLKLVTVTVSWRGRTGKAASITLQTVVTNRTGHTST